MSQISRLPIAGIRRRSLLQLAAGSLAVPAAFTAEAQMSLASAINRAARFRALSQRCAKAYLQLHLEVMPDGARDVLASAQRLIQVGFEDLARGNFPAAVNQQVAGIRKESDELMRMLAAPPSKANISGVSAQADKMLIAAQKATEAIEGLTKVTSAKLVDLAGRQRMLSQRLAKNYFLTAAGFDAKPLREQMMSDSSDFIDALGTLTAAPLSTANIRNELQLGQQQWMFFEGALGRKAEGNALRTVATTSERLLEVMNNLALMYEDALRELLGQA
jgi:hypothetical protein